MSTAGSASTDVPEAERGREVRAVTVASRARVGPVALLWAGIVTFLAGQAWNRAWHGDHELEAGSGLFHNPGTVVAGVGFGLVILGAVLVTLAALVSRKQPS